MSYLPSPDASGQCEHPYRHISLDTVLGICRCGCQQTTVFHEDGTVCLPQTVKFRNNVGILTSMMQTRFVHVFAAYLQQTRLDPSEFFLIRDELPLEYWSLAFGLCSPHVLALCIMARDEPDSFIKLGLLIPHSSKPSYSPQFRLRLEAVAAEYLAGLPDRFFSVSYWQSVVRPMSLWSPLQILFEGNKKHADLANFFNYHKKYGDDGFALSLSMMDPLTTSLLHMAKFDPGSYASLISSMDQIPDPTKIQDDSVHLTEQEMRLNKLLTEYYVARLRLLAELPLVEEDYSDSDWRDLFDLSE